MEPAADASGHPPHDCSQALVLSQLVAADALDAALEAGLMAFLPCASCDVPSVASLLATRHKLTTAWAARDRYAARNARLARIAAERDTRRAPIQVEKKTSLPPSAAAVLARAKARAAERGAR